MTPEQRMQVFLKDNPDCWKLTLANARKWVNSKCESGVTCPVCSHPVKVYSRGINREDVLVLGKLRVVRPFGEYAHVKEFTPSFRYTPSHLRFFDLIEPKPLPLLSGSDGIARGIWRLTQLGVDFLDGAARVRACVRLLLNKRVGFFGDLLDVHEVFGSQFLYPQSLTQP